MKFTPWQLVTVLAILLAAVILANVFAPGAVATVVSMATTVIGALFVNRHDGDPPAGPTNGAGPGLSVISGGLSALAIVAMLAGCGPSAAAIESAAAGGDVSAQLAKCRAEARSAYYVEKKSEAEALAVYEACKKREGVQ